MRSGATPHDNKVVMMRERDDDYGRGRPDPRRDERDDHGGAGRRYDDYDDRRGGGDRYGGSRGGGYDDAPYGGGAHGGGGAPYGGGGAPYGGGGAPYGGGGGDPYVGGAPPYGGGGGSSYPRGSSGGGGGGGAASAEQLSELDIIQLAEARSNAKMRSDFEEADRLRDELSRHGINIDDRSKMWTARDGRSGQLPQGGGFARGDKLRDDGSIEWANTIYVAGLPMDVTIDELADFFGKIGKIKASKKSFNQGEPTIHLYKDKRTGRLKGDATISYEETETAKAAVKWFDGTDFTRGGQRLNVSIAQRPAQGNWGKGKGKGKGGGKGGW